MHLLFLGLVLGVFSCVPNIALAQSDDPSINQEVRQTLQSRWQRTDVDILQADEPLNARRSAKTNKENKSNINTNPDIMRGVAIVLIIGLLAFGIYLLWHHRLGGGLFAKNDKDTVVDVDGVEIGGMDEAASNEFSLDQLKSMTDTKSALRLLLVNVLARTARINNIPLRRSLTARDIVHRIPPAWRSRERVADLVAQAEPVVFGGRTIDSAHLDALIDLARPVLAHRTP